MTDVFIKPQHTALRAALRDFNEEYAACLNSNQLERWPDFFVEDCHYRVLSKENFDANLPIGVIYCMNKNMLRDRVTALRQTTVYEPRALRHLFGGVDIKKVEGNSIFAETNFLIVESLSDRDPILNMAGRYVDEILHKDGGFLIRSRDVVHDNYRVLTSLIIPV